MDLTTCSAVVSGGAGGLGGATSRRLVQLGVGVVVFDPDGEKGATLANELGALSRATRTTTPSSPVPFQPSVSWRLLDCRERRRRADPSAAHCGPGRYASWRTRRARTTYVSSTRTSSTNQGQFSSPQGRSRLSAKAACVRGPMTTTRASRRTGTSP